MAQATHDIDVPEREVQESDLTIRVRNADGTDLVQLFGELDMSSAPTLRTEIERLEHRSASLEVDLSGLNFIDSKGLAEFVHLHRQAAARDWPLRLRRGGTAVERVFRLTGLSAALPFVD